LGHLTRKIVFEMTYNVSSGTLNPTIPYQTRLLHCFDSASILFARLGVTYYRKVARWTYVAIIRLMITHSAVVWWPPLELVVVRTECLQRLACLEHHWSNSTTPTAAM